MRERASVLERERESEREGARKEEATFSPFSEQVSDESFLKERSDRSVH